MGGISKLRSPWVRVLIAFGAQLLTGGLWAVIDAASLSKLAPLLIVSGLAIILLAYFWDEIRAYVRWKRGPRHLYVSSVSERLPMNGPAAPFRCYQIFETNSPDIKWGWTEQSGAIDWDGGVVRPKCQRIELTNHSNDTLVNVTIVIELQSFGKPGEPPPLKQYEMPVEFEQIVAGGTGTAFIVNDSPMAIVGRPIRARGTQIGGSPHDLSLHTKSFSSITLFAADRFLPSVIEAEEDGPEPPDSKVPSALGAIGLDSKLSSAEWVSTAKVEAEQLDQTRTQHRRALIKDCRDIVQQYRDEKMPEPFGTFLDTKRPYIDAKPHLGDEYWQERIKREDRPDTEAKRNWDSSMFERELARLEKEWGL